MDVVKPSCYDDVPACLCVDCQLYDVKQMVLAKSTAVSSRSPFLPSYAASLLSRPSCSVATSTSGLAVTDVAEPVYEPDVAEPVYESDAESAYEPDRFPRRPFLSRPRLDFADLSSPCFLPAESSRSAVFSPAVTSSCPVSTAAPRVWSGPVPPSRPVVSVSHGSPVSSFAVSPAAAFGCSVSSPAPRVWPGPVSSAAASSPVRSVAASPVVSVPPSPVGPVVPPCRLLPGPSWLPHCRPVSPMACFVLVLLPVLLPTSFGFVLSFLPVLR